MSSMATTQSLGHGRSKEMLVEQYLEREVRAGEYYFKSKFIAEDIELSAQQIGAAIAKLRQQSDLLEIEKWSYTNGTTWRITLTEDEP